MHDSESSELVICGIKVPPVTCCAGCAPSRAAAVCPTGRSTVPAPTSRQAIQLLNWSSCHDIPLSACSQDLIDAWLDENPARGPRVQGFLVCTSRKGHTRQLAVPLGTPALTGQLIAQDARWGLVSRLIHDEEIPIVDKTAGLLALLFAQQPHRIAELTTDDVHVSADAVALRRRS
ncbi:hypothetical protein GCM10010234_65860 [Streptomyces hawaiiensis]